MSHFAREIGETLLLAALLFLLLRLSTQNYCVHMVSMEPLLRPGDCVYVNKVAYLRVPVSGIFDRLPFVDVSRGKASYPLGVPRRGDVVVLREPSGQGPDLVKRVVALEGDVVAMERGQVYLNGAPLDEPFISALPVGQRMSPLRVPPDHVFVMGDNRPASRDSRIFGPIPRSLLIGRAWVRFWPLGSSRFLQSFKTLPQSPAPTAGGGARSPGHVETVDSPL